MAKGHKYLTVMIFRKGPEKGSKTVNVPDPAKHQILTSSYIFSSIFKLNIEDNSPRLVKYWIFLYTLFM